MMKALFATTAVALAVPAFAQDTGAVQATPPTEAPADPTASAEIQAQTLPAPEQPAAPATDASAATAADAHAGHDANAQAATNEQATAEPAPDGQATEQAAATNSADAVTRVVESDFANYDGNGDGQLSKEEFGAWMTALRSSSAQADAGDAGQWTEQAFAQADIDRNQTISRGEVTQFLQG